MVAFQRVTMAPCPSSPGSANDRQVRFTFSITCLSCFGAEPLVLIPISANGLSVNFVTSDRSWGHWDLQVSQYSDQKSSSTTLPR
jgi:hypothetical protein